MFMFLPYANDTLLIIDATAGIYKGILDIDNISSPTLNIEEIDFPIEKELLQNSILDAKKLLIVIFFQLISVVPMCMI